MRSNDVYLGLPHDIFCFTMLQEIMARGLDVNIGRYIHTIGSLHLYTKDQDKAAAFVKEGWQSTENPMPPMPLGDPWPSISVLLEAERIIRQGEQELVTIPQDLDSYWVDFIKILQIFKNIKSKDRKKASAMLEELESGAYDCFINKRLDEISSPVCSEKKN